MPPGAVHYIVVSTLLHLIWLCSIHDLYYVGNHLDVNHSITPCNHSLRPPANRVVMFAIKGLNLNDSFGLKNDSQSLMPSLRTIIRRNGRWGVLHYNVTTNGMQRRHMYPANPINAHLTGNTQLYTTKLGYELYDDIIMSSTRSWVWTCGKYAIEAAWSVSNVEYRMNRMCGEEDRRMTNSTKYHSWLFDSVEELLLIQTNTKAVSDKIHSSKAIFLFNLDITSSLKVNTELAMIDKRMNYTIELINSFFNDSRTSFLIFGLSNDPTSHVKTFPFVATGAGIKHPRSSQYGDYRYHDHLSDMWKLDKFERIDLNIVDITPLMASLLGTRIPLYSEGVIPYGYIHYNKEFVAESLLCNTRQFLEKLRVKEDEIQSQFMAMFFKPYNDFTAVKQSERIKRLTEMIDKRKLQEAIVESLAFIEACKEAMEYFNTYHHLPIKGFLVISILGWMLYTVTLLLCERHTTNGLSAGYFPSFLGVGLCLSLMAVLYYWNNASFSHLLYMSMAVLCWDFAFRNMKVAILSVKSRTKNVSQFVLDLVILSPIPICLEVMFLSVVHHSSWYLVLFVGIAALVPFVTLQNNNSIRFTLFWCLVWLLFMCTSSLCTSTTYIGRFGFALSCSLLTVLCIYIFRNPPLHYRLSMPRIRFCSFLDTVVFDVFVFSVSVLLTCIQSLGLHKYSDICRFSSYLVSIVAMSSLPFGSKSVLGRLLHVSMMLYVFQFMTMGISNSLFLSCLLCILYCSLYIAEHVPCQEEQVISLWDGMFGCLCFSDFPNRRPALKPKLPSISDMFRAGYLWILVFYISFNSVICFDNLIMSLHSFSLTTLTSFASLFILLFCIYCFFNVLVIKTGCTLETFFYSCILLMDALGVQVYLATDGELHNNLPTFVMIVSNALLCPAIFMLARIIIGDSIIPRKTFYNE